MKKNYIKSTAILFLSTVILIGFSACSNNSSTNETKQNEEVNENSTQKSVEVPDNIQNMLEPSDAILMCRVEGKFSYTPKDPTFFWAALYDFTCLYGAKHPLSKVTDTELIMPRQAVQEYATALFADYNDLLDLPESLSDHIKYDADTDTYSFGLGDRGLSQPEIIGFTDNGDGSYILDVALKSLDEGNIICSGKFTIVPNEYASSMSDPIYNFSISQVDFND